MSCQEREIRKAKQMGLHLTKKLLHSKETINKMKRQPTEWEHICRWYIQ